MSRSTLAAEIRRLRSKLAPQGRSEDGDEQLLHEFCTHREDSAFAVLVRRYGPMVLHVCRRVLGHHQDAEDAFQATFLVLARNAATMRKQTALASFLHGIAYRTAMKAKRNAARRRKHERRAPAHPPADPADALSWQEVKALLDEEIARLPEKYRSVFVLFHLEDLSREETARRLGLKDATVAKRLATARKRLSQRLSRRGVELTAVLAATAVATPSASALPAGLMATTIEAALATAAGEQLAGIVSATVAELVQSATTAMMVSKAKIATVILLTATMLAGASVWAYRRVAANALSPSALPAEPAATANDKPKVAPSKPDAAKMEIQGRVLNPDDNPVKGACLHWPRFRKDLPKAEDRLEWVERGRSDDQGRFRIKLPAGEDLDDSLRQLIVTAAGYGLTWVELPKAKPSENVTVRMRKDVTIQGRILSMEGRPLAGVRVSAERLEEMPNGRLDDYLAHWKQDWNKTLRLQTRQLRLPSKNAILSPTATDAKGCFQLSGVGSERIVHLVIRGEGIARANLPIVARPDFDPSDLNKSARNPTAMMRARISGPAPPLYGPTFDYAALPERVVEGVVREAGSGKPVPGVRIHGHIQGNASYRADSEAITDKEGRYRLEGFAKVPKALLIVRAEPPPDSPWLLSVQGKEAEAGQGLQPVQVDFTLGRGVILKGRVSDRATGKGVVSQITFSYLPDNKYAGKPGYDGLIGLFHRTDDEGRFRLKVVPGTGVLSVMADGASNPYKPARFDAEDRKHITFAEDSDFRTFGGGPGFLRELNAVKWLDLDPGAGVVEQNLSLERGATAKVRIQDPQRKPLSGVIVSGIDAVPVHHIHKAFVAPEAECTIVALEPSHPRQVVFYHAERRLVGTLIVRGDEKEPLTVQLAPTGAVAGRLRNADGEPIQGAEIEVAAGGPRPFSSLTSLYLYLNGTRLTARTDKEGRFRLEGVVPGSKFSIGIRLRGAFLDGGPRTRQLQVKPGETIDLGAILIKSME